VHAVFSQNAGANRAVQAELLFAVIEEDLPADNQVVEIFAGILRVSVLFGEVAFHVGLPAA